jgi:choline dehydrogenase
LWVDAVGNENWSWENVLPYYKKSCQFTPPNTDKIGHEFDIPYDTDAFSLYGGPLQVSYGDYRGVYVNPVSEGLEKIGLKKLPGLNSGKLIGYGAITLTIDPETLTRSSSETSFLQSAMARSSTLKIYPSTLAKKILFDDGKRASGVLVGAKGDREYEFVLSAKREVILAAGVVSLTLAAAEKTNEELKLIKNSFGRHNY